MYTLEEYRMKSALIEQVIDNLNSAIIVLDTDTNIVLANKVAENLANKSKLHLFGLQGGEAFNCIHADDDPMGCGYGVTCRDCVLRNTFEKTIHTKESQVNIEASMTFFDKGHRILSVTTSWLSNSELTIVALNDITEMKQQEVLRLKHTKLQAAIKTGGAVCHEMNQPLSVISGYIDLMIMDYNPDEAYKNMIIIKEQIIRLGGITRKLMNITSFKEMMYLSDTILDIDKSVSTQNE
ncbi:MAG: histidine kinase [Candidatus Latescibacteria bacterium]|nr:histidine kinase [Candidatus Latescibacterota bacterium]